MSITFAEFARFTFSPDGRGSTRDLSDEDLGRAIADTGNLLDAAVALSEQHGRIVARTDIAARVEASPVLQHVLEVARAAHMQRAAANAIRRIAEDRDLKALERERREGPRCGATCRDGRRCQRRPVLGRTRCASHGGCTPTARRTPRARSLRRANSS